MIILDFVGQPEGSSNRGSAWVGFYEFLVYLHPWSEDELLRETHKNFLYLTI